MKRWFSCFGGSTKTCPSPSTPKRGGVKQLTNKQLRMLLQLGNVSNIKKRFVQRELRRRNKENYGYELAKLFGGNTVPSNKTRVSYGNIMGRILREGGANMSKFRLTFDPEHASHFANSVRRSAQKPETKLYRTKRKSAAFEFQNMHHPSAYRNTTWRFYSTPLQHRNRIIYYTNRNSVPFLIDKKSGARKQVPARLLQGGVGNLIPRNMNRNTINAYRRRVNQHVKQVKSLMKTNNYATGRSKTKPNISSLRYYFNTHPRALQLTNNYTRNIAGIQNQLRNRLANNLLEHMSVPTNQNLQEKLLKIANATNIPNLLKRMNAYEKNAGRTWSLTNRHVFNIIRRRALSRNKQGFYSV